MTCLTGQDLSDSDANHLTALITRYCVEAKMEYDFSFETVGLTRENLFDPDRRDDRQLARLIRLESYQELFDEFVGEMAQLLRPKAFKTFDKFLELGQHLR